MNLCITCSYYERNPESPNNLEVGLCARVPSEKSLVTGLPVKPTNNYANVQRLAHMECGVDGKQHTSVSIPFATQAEVDEMMKGDHKHV